MGLYFEPTYADVKARRIVQPVPGGDDGIQAAIAVPFAEGWSVQAPQPTTVPLNWKRSSGVLPGGDDADANTDAIFSVWRLFGFEQAPPPQPPAIRYFTRHASLLNSGATESSNQSPLAVPFRSGWDVLPVQPPAPSRRSIIGSAAVARGDEGTQLIFIPPWSFATPASSFPDNQAMAAAAIPTWNAGPQIGAIKSMPNILGPVVLKASPGTLFSISVVTAGSANGGFYDSASINGNVTANQIFAIPNTVGIYVLEWPCQQGILIVPGTGQALAVKWD